MLIGVKNWLIQKAVESIGGQKFLSLQIDITNACNLKCSHCYHSNHKNTGALDLEGWLSVLDQYEALLKKLHLKPAISICGGEPLISPLLLPLLENLEKRFPGVKIYILTNGTKVTDSFLYNIQAYNTSFQVSLDGPDQNRHDQIRGAGSFEKAVAGIKLLRHYKKEVLILSILSRTTSQWLPDFFKLAKELNVNAMNFTRLIPVGFGEGLVQSGKDDVLLKKDLKNAMESVVQYSKVYGIKTSTNQPLYNLIDPKLGSHGKIGFQGLVIDYKGNLKVSSRINYSLGSVLEDGLENLFLKHPVMRSLRQGKIKGCGTCPHYSRCGGDRNMSFAITGNFISQDIGCWLNPAAQKREGA